jgi:hypothetical protein
LIVPPESHAISGNVWRFARDGLILFFVVRIKDDGELDLRKTLKGELPRRTILDRPRPAR